MIHIEINRVDYKLRAKFYMEVTGSKVPTTIEEATTTEEVRRVCDLWANYIPQKLYIEVPELKKESHTMSVGAEESVPLLWSFRIYSDKDSSFPVIQKIIGVLQEFGRVEFIKMEFYPKK